VIFIVEDLKPHFTAMQGYVRELFPNERHIWRVQSANAVDRVIDFCRKRSVRPVLIIDLDMGVREHDLIKYVANLWTRDDDKWLASVPIVVWSLHVHRLPPLPRRARSSIVDKVASIGLADFAELYAALQKAIA
jgi:hypothetical protein